MNNEALSINNKYHVLVLLLFVIFFNSLSILIALIQVDYFII